MCSWNHYKVLIISKVLFVSMVTAACIAWKLSKWLLLNKVLVIEKKVRRPALKSGCGWRYASSESLRGSEMCGWAHCCDAVARYWRCHLVHGWPFISSFVQNLIARVFSKVSAIAHCRHRCDNQTRFGCAVKLRIPFPPFNTSCLNALRSVGAQIYMYMYVCVC